jgi:hypothetical protein
MKILNLYFSSTGNTEKVALKIDETVTNWGTPWIQSRSVQRSSPWTFLTTISFLWDPEYTVNCRAKSSWIFTRALLQRYVKAGEIKPASPRRPSSHVVVYCTYGGVHTGINEAIPAVKYMGQLFDYLGFTILAEWYVVGEYMTKKLKSHSVGGRLGDIRGRPNRADLEEVAEKVKGVL